MTGLAVEALVAGYEPGLPILRGVDLAVADGAIVALLGPNGAGKSTLVKAIAGLVPVASGRIRLGAADITGLAAHRMVRHGLAYVPQLENVFTTLSVAENLALAASVLPRAARRRCLAAQYALFPDLARQAPLPAGRLSGGQRQMLACARALMAEPRVLLLDEPSAGLSPKLVAELFRQLQAIRASGVTILLVEQNAKAALAIADRAVVLADGLVRLDRPAAGLLDDPALGRVYLGQAAAAPC